MWSRAELKTRSKGVMKRSYWLMFAVSLVSAFLCGELMNFTRDFTEDYQWNSLSFSNVSYGWNEASRIIASNAFITTTLITILLVGILLSALYSIFIANPIQLGKSRYFLQNIDEKAEFTVMFSGFGPNYMNIVKILFVRNLKLFLWTLLLIIPGIIKAYEYQMIPYLLAEDPSMPMSEAFSKSKEMTRKQKADMFVLDLSFLGWDILGSFLFGIGGIFILPYKNSVYAELYVELKSLYKPEFEDAY